MSDAGVIGRGSAEGDVKNFVVVVGSEVEKSGAGFNVSEQKRFRAELIDGRAIDEFESVELVIDFKIRVH